MKPNAAVCHPPGWHFCIAVLASHHNVSHGTAKSNQPIPQLMPEMCDPKLTGICTVQSTFLLKAAALGLVLVAAVALAVQPALWALQYATATRGRLTMLGTWAALLVAALPLMDCMARSHRIPTIIVRKVGPCAAAAKPHTCIVGELVKVQWSCAYCSEVNACV